MKELVLIAGPCVIESRELVLSIAEKVKEITEGLKLNLYSKLALIRRIEVLDLVLEDRLRKRP